MASSGADFESLLRSLHGSLVSSGKVQEVTEQFSRLETDMERVQFLLKMPESAGLQQAAGGAVPPSSTAATSNQQQVNGNATSEQLQANGNDTSEQLRADGNACFGRGEHAAALRLYSEAVQRAPAGSEQRGLALANCSAAHFQLGEYRRCEQDVLRALQHAYPCQLRYKLHERLGEARRRRGDGAGAERAFCAALTAARAAPLDARRRKQLLVRLDGLVCSSAANRVRRLLETGQEGPEEQNGQEHEQEQTSPPPTQKSKKQRADRQETGVKRRRDERKAAAPPPLTQLPPLSYDQSEVVASASAAVDLVVTEEKGRTLVANRDLVPGDIVIVEPALCCATLPDAWATHCYQCCRRLPAAQVPCASCPSVQFCSEACRSAAAGQHELECGLLERLLQLDVGPMALLALRLVTAAGPERLRHERLARSDSGSSAEGTPDKDPLHAALDLVGHTGLRSVADLFRRTATAVCLASLLYSNQGHSSTHTAENMQQNGTLKENSVTTLKENGVNEEGDSSSGKGSSESCSDLEETAAALLHFLQSLPCNAHEISEQVQRGGESELKEVGAAVYPSVSLLNHACEPNVLRVSHGTGCVVRVIRPVRAGEELLDNYGFHWAVQSWDQRQAALKRQYYFDCRCQACAEDWALHEDLPEKEYFRCDLCDAPPMYCYHEKDAGKLEMFARSRKVYLKTMEKMRERDGKAEDLATLVSHLTVMENVVAKPSKEYNNCQEAVKLHFFAKGNSYKESTKTETTTETSGRAVESKEALNCIERLYGKNKRVAA